jgi:hypothetical protein
MRWHLRYLKAGASPSALPSLRIATLYEMTASMEMGERAHTIAISLIAKLLNRVDHSREQLIWKGTEWSNMRQTLYIMFVEVVNPGMSKNHSFASLN